MHYEENHIAICDLVWVEYIIRICIYWFDEIVSFEIKMIDLTWVNSRLMAGEMYFTRLSYCGGVCWHENESLSLIKLFSWLLIIVFCMLCFWRNCDELWMQYFVRLRTTWTYQRFSCYLSRTWFYELRLDPHPTSIRACLKLKSS